MVLSASYIRSLPGDSECMEALAWLATNAKKYPTGGFTPPLTPRARASDIAPLAAMSFRLGRGKLRGSGSVVSRVDWHAQSSSGTAVGVVKSIVSELAASCLPSLVTGTIILTSGARRGTLDCFLDSLGPHLLKLGYTLAPCLSGGSVSFIIIRKGRKKWTLAYLENVSGAPIGISLALARSVANEYATRERAVLALYHAGVAYSAWLLREFGVVLRPTCGMIAMDAARVTLPSGFRKWRPDPLLVAMERQGYGFRGGMTFARRYSGPTWRIDVTRQYTAALAGSLPLRSAFGMYRGDLDTRPGVYMCRLRTGSMLPYPVGIWQGGGHGFVLQTVGRGEYVCVLHTSEFPGLVASGAIITPTWGFTFTATFSFSNHVLHLQRLLTSRGRESPESVLSKPLGNYIYGKTAQNPRRTELLFSESNPGKQWYPYWDEQGVAWPMIWERTVERYTGSQHIDIGSTITAAARSQTIQMWASLLASGSQVVRCHTDSLTTDQRPELSLLGPENRIGSWRLETEDDASIIVGSNAYFDQDGAHIAGVTSPTFEMIDRMMDGQVVRHVQSIKTPRRGFGRGERDEERALRATAT